MWSVIITFAAVVVIIYLSYVFSKMVSQKITRGGSSRYMRVLDQIVLGQDRHLAVVQVGEQYLLLGITGGQISLLGKLSEEDLLPLSPEDGDSQGKAPDFGELMKKMGNFTKRGR